MGWDGRLFEAGCLLTFSAFRMGAYSRWALIRGWAFIQINTVSTEGNLLFKVDWASLIVPWNASGTPRWFGLFFIVPKIAKPASRIA